MKKNKKDSDYAAKKAGDNSSKVDAENEFDSLGIDAGLIGGDLGESLRYVANLEAGTDIMENGDLGESLRYVANLEAGTDVALNGSVGDGLGVNAGMEAGADAAFAGSGMEMTTASGLGGGAGVTDNALYHNLASYKMIPLNDDSIQNNQGS